MKRRRALLLAVPILAVGTASFGAIDENFNDFTDTTYGNYTVRDFALTNCTSETDTTRQIAFTRGVRIRNAANASLEVVGSDGNGKDGGVGQIDFDWREWDSTPAVNMAVEVSINGGAYTSIGSLTASGTAGTSTPGNVQHFTYVLNNASDNIKIRIINAAVAGERVTVDNFDVTDYVASDTTPPAKPATPDLDTASDSGSSTTDNITNDNTPTFSGTAEAGSTVRLYAGAVEVGSATATGGNWSITASTLADSTYNMTVTATDAANNTSEASDPLSVTIDTTAPAAPSTAFVSGSDTGVSNSDGIINIVDPFFTYTTSENDIQFRLFNGGSEIVYSFSFFPGSPSFNLGPGQLNEGSNTLTSSFTDKAGNVANSSTPGTVVLDTVDPVTGASSPALVVGNSITVNFTANDATSGIDETLVDLFVKAPASGSFLDSGLSAATATTFVYTAAASGVYEFHTIGQDVAGNVETKTTGETTTIVNLTENGTLTLPAGVGSNVVLTFPMESGLSIVITFNQVTTPGDVTVRRIEGDGDAATLGLNAEKLAGQYIDIVAAGGLVFDTATIEFVYDEALLGSELTEGQINAAFRATDSTTYEIVSGTLDAGTNTFTVTGVTGFSDWYLGDATASAGEWMILDEE